MFENLVRVGVSMKARYAMTGTDRTAILLWLLSVHIAAGGGLQLALAKTVSPKVPVRPAELARR